MAPTDLLYTGLPTNLQFLVKKNGNKAVSIKRNKTRYA